MSSWEPPEFISREDLVKISDEVFAMPELEVNTTEDIVTVNTLGMDWDLGVVIHQPADESKIAVGADGKKVGILVLHGGASDFKSLSTFIKVLVSRFGFKVFAGTFPGRFYFDNPDHDWPDDTIHDDGSVRTPIWKRGEYIGRDEYDVIEDFAVAKLHGTRTFARAKPGTNFYYRMAAWPAAFEEGMVEACRQNFPIDEYSVYGTGHSTGGPFICMLSQRIPNFAGILAMETSPFGFLGDARNRWEGPVVAGVEEPNAEAEERLDPFNELYIRTWRDLARYAGPEALGDEGGGALMRLPALMEGILNMWQERKSRPQFKAEMTVHSVQIGPLTEAANVTADRLSLNEEERAALIDRFLGYCYELKGEGAVPVPNVLFGIAKNSRDHSPGVYNEVILPGFRAMRPEPKVRLTRFDAGGHSYWLAQEGLPVGDGPAAAKIWYEGITNGYFLR